MIKFKAIESDGSPFYGFGLSKENINRLRQGYPISINMDDLGGTGKVLIFYGKNEQTMARELAQFIGPDTHVEIDPRLKDS